MNFLNLLSELVFAPLDKLTFLEQICLCTGLYFIALGLIMWIVVLQEMKS